MQVSWPVNDLAVGVVGFLGAERRPADQALEHDGSDTPPVTAIVVALSAEDLGSDVVWSTDGRVGELATRLAPSVDLVAVAHGELDLVEGDGLAVCLRRAAPAVRHELLVVRSVVLLVETGGESEVGELDVTTAVEKDVVRLDVAGSVSTNGNQIGPEYTHRWMKPSLWTASIARVISAM